MHKPTGNGDMKTGHSETRDTFPKSFMCLVQLPCLWFCHMVIIIS